MIETRRHKGLRTLLAVSSPVHYLFFAFFESIASFGRNETHETSLEELYLWKELSTSSLLRRILLEEKEGRLKLTIPARNFLCAADARRTGKATNIKAGGCGRFSFRPASTNSRHGFATERSRDAGSIRQRRSA